ncbi:MAG TPA: hypothetical protein PLT35_09870 [Vicinamibacterales bacterium]|nr:hypothetical protein [Vicinamibacterales bacterium]
MTFRTLLVIKALVCLVFGVILLAAPARLFGLLGEPVSGAGAFEARECGAAVTATLVPCWLARGIPWTSRRSHVLGRVNRTGIVGGPVRREAGAHGTTSEVLT